MTYKIYNEDCLEGMKRIPDGSVDIILDDLPFGSTDCYFDKKLPLNELWKQFLRVTKSNAAIVLFSQMPFGAEIIQSQPKLFRYEFIYDKALPTSFLNSKRMPLRRHENILVFYQALPTYNPQFTQGKPYKRLGGERGSANYGKHFRETKEYYGGRFPSDVLRARQPYCDGNGSFHPQEKPVNLLEYLIKTYTNEGETVLDATMGSGSTGIAAVNTGRKFIGFELTAEYFATARKRIVEVVEYREKIFLRLKNEKLKVIEVPTSDLKPYENNPRDNDGAVEAVANSIEQFGFKVPLVVDRDNVIVVGHTRYKAAKKLGLEKVPCAVASDLSPEQIKAFRLIDNKTAELSSWSIADLNSELAALTDFDMTSFGFKADAVKAAEISSADYGEVTSTNGEETASQESTGMVFKLHKEQAKLINRAISAVKKDSSFDGSKAEDCICEIIRQWQEATENASA